MEAPIKPDFSDVLSEVSADAKHFLRAQRDYTLLIASEKAAKAGRSMVGGMITLALLSAVMLMMSVALAYLIAERVGSVAMGFFYTGCGYVVVLGLFILLWKSRIGKTVQLNIINAFHEHD